ncbi:MAG: hypothetical protein ABW104_08555 [Candidatus Thiodiazotropha sp. 6PLUC2]
MKYLQRDQLRLYLKMGREITQFIGVGEYFESTTFDWVLMSGTEEEAKIELIRSVDEGDEYYCDVMSFSTIGDDDPEELKEFRGTLDQCISWLSAELGGSPDKFLGKGMIDQAYEAYVKTRG